MVMNELDISKSISINTQAPFNIGTRCAQFGPFHLHERINNTMKKQLNSLDEIFVPKILLKAFN